MNEIIKPYEKTQQTVGQALKKLSQPWVTAGEPPPSVMVKQLARETGVSPTSVIDAVTKGTIVLDFAAPLQAYVVDRSGIPVNGNVLEAATAAAPAKRVLYRARYESTAPGGGPVVKARIDEGKIPNLSLDLGKERLRVSLQPPGIFNGTTKKSESKRAKQTAIKEKQASRAERKVEREEQKMIRQIARETMPPEIIATEALEILRRFDQFGGSLDSDVILQRFAQALRKRGSISFLQFTCPKIDTRLLASPRPEEYLLTDPSGNNFESTASRLMPLVRQLKAADIPSDITIVIGDTDETDYLFPVIEERSLEEGLSEIRKTNYKNNLYKRIAKAFPELGFELYRWSEIQAIDAEGVASLPDLAFDEGDIEDEIVRMTEIFGKGNYYDGIRLPSLEDLRQIVLLKFRSYAEQGRVLTRFFPEAVLLQNEFPLLLRTKMLNAKNTQEGASIPALYPYRKSESPY